MNEEPLDLNQGIGDLGKLTRLLWAQACSWDGIHPSVPQAVFSPENPYQARYRRVYQAWRALRYPAVGKRQ